MELQLQLCLHQSYFLISQKKGLFLINLSNKKETNQNLNKLNSLSLQGTEKQSTSNKAAPLYVLPKQIETKKNKKRYGKNWEKKNRERLATKNDYRYRFGKELQYNI